MGKRGKKRRTTTREKAVTSNLSSAAEFNTRPNLELPRSRRSGAGKRVRQDVPRRKGTSSSRQTPETRGLVLSYDTSSKNVLFLHVVRCRHRSVVGPTGGQSISADPSFRLPILRTHDLSIHLSNLRIEVKKGLGEVPREHGVGVVDRLGQLAELPLVDGPAIVRVVLSE